MNCHETGGITKSKGQSTLKKDEVTLENESLVSDAHWMDIFVEQLVPSLTLRTRQFAVDREWLGYHTPRNLLLALMGELGELAEIFQFKGDNEDNQDLPVEEQDKVGQEIADVTIYLLRLADVCGVSLNDEVKRLEREVESTN